LGELSPREQVHFERIMESSALCRLRVYETRQLIGQLEAVPEPGTHADLLPGILARIDAEVPAVKPTPKTAVVARLQWLRAAALWMLLPAVAGVLLARWIQPVRTASQTPAVEAAVPTAGNTVFARLAARQRADGAWDVGSAEDADRHRISATALVLLALLRHHVDTAAGPYDAVIRRGVNYLVEQQQPDGRIGPRTQCKGYDQQLAAAALVTASRSYPDRRLSAACKKALAYPVRHNAGHSEWAYDGSRYVRPPVVGAAPFADQRFRQYVTDMMAHCCRIQVWRDRGTEGPGPAGKAEDPGTVQLVMAATRLAL
jgi:hypothetical protein